jgi:Skp family chaperone for outer membrane proteins
MFYQKEPVYTLVIIGVGLFFYLFYKAKKSGNGLLGTFMSGNQTSQDRRFDDLMALIMLQQLLSNNSQGSSASREISEESQKRREEIDKIQNEVLDLLDSD